MKIIYICVTLVALLVTANTSGEPQTSAKKYSSASVAIDSLSDDGRLIIRVAILNRARVPVAFSDNAVQLFTADDKPIKLMTLDQLIQEVEATSHHKQTTREVQAPINAGGGNNALIRDMRDSGGNLVSDNSGATIGYVDDKRATSSKLGVKLDAKTEAKIAALKAGVLQSQLVPSGQIVSGQVVTEKLNLPENEPAIVKVKIAFNDETHEFSLALPDKPKTK